MTSTPAPPTVSEDTPWPSRSLVLLCGVSLLAFAGGLLVTEWFGEIGTDIDLKPFFIPYLLIAAVRFGLPTLAVGFGAAVGEGVLDVFEGYELDDPVGFVGYVLGFVIFGWYLHRVADDPSSRRGLAVAAILGAFVQAFFESFAFLLFEPAAGTRQAALSLVGNTLSHGILLGAIPLLFFVPLARAHIRTRLRP